MKNNTNSTQNDGKAALKILYGVLSNVGLYSPVS